MTEAPQPPEAPAPAPPAAAQGGGNGLAIAGMILGIVGLVGLCLWYIGLPCAIVGLILSIQGKKKAKVTGTGAGMATTGVVISCVAIGLTVLLLILAAVGIAFFGSKIDEIQKSMPKDMPRQSMAIIRSLLA